MSLNCLTCSQLLQRTDSFGDLLAEEEFKKIYKQVDRRWSSNISSSTPTKSEQPKGGGAAVAAPKSELAKGGPLASEQPKGGGVAVAAPKSELAKGGPLAKLKAGHRRTCSTGDVPYPPGSSGPKLVRSSGMRRNWSFEDVTENQDEAVTVRFR